MGLNSGDQVKDVTIQQGTIADTSQFDITESGSVTIFARSSLSGNALISTDIFVPSGETTTLLINQGTVVGLPLSELPPGDSIPPIIIFPPLPPEEPVLPELPVPDHQQRCRSIAQAAAAQSLARKIEQSLAASNAIKEIERLLKTKIVKEPEDIVLSQPEDSGNLSVKFITNEEDIRLSAKVTDKVDLDIEIDLKDITDIPDIPVDPSEITLLSTDYGIGIEVAEESIESLNPAIATVSEKNIDKENKKITATIQGVQPGKTEIRGGFARLNIKITVTVSYSIGGQPCPSISVPDIALPASIEMDSFSVPVEVKGEPTPTPPPLPNPRPTLPASQFPGEVTLSCGGPFTGQEKGWITVTTQYPVLSDSPFGDPNSASFYLELTSYSGVEHFYFTPAPIFFVQINSEGTIYNVYSDGHTGYGKFAWPCGPNQECRATYTITEVFYHYNNWNLPQTSPPIGQTVECIY